MKKLFQVYDQLLSDRIPDEGVFNVKEFPSNKSHYLGIDSDVNLVLLLRTEEGKISKPSFRLKFIDVTINANCTIWTDNGDTNNEVLSIIKLKSSNEEFQKYFLGICQNLVDQLGIKATAEAIEKEIDSLIALFKTLSKPSLRSVEGILGELLIIFQSQNRDRTIRSWHIDNKDLFDFIYEDQCLEIKSTLKQTRQHRFSLNQLIEPPNKKVFVASILLEQNDNGKNIFDVFYEIRNGLSVTESITKLDQHLFSLAGDQIEEILKIRFNIDYSLSNIKYYDVLHIPKIHSNHIPNEISNLKFDILLDAVPEAQKNLLKMFY